MTKGLFTSTEEIEFYDILVNGNIKFSKEKTPFLNNREIRLNNRRIAQNVKRLNQACVKSRARMR